MREIHRRDFLKFLGASTLTASQVSFLNLLTSCQSIATLSFEPLKPTLKDDLVLASGLSYYKLISYGDQITTQDIFGFNNDYIDIHALNEREILMWVNHEYVNPLFIGGEKRSKKNIDQERKLVGGSIIKIEKNQFNRWHFVPYHENNRAIRGDSKIPFNQGVSIQNQNFAIGTLGNCAGGKTPWGTFLSCEENYQDFYGERDRQTGAISSSYLAWEKFYPLPPEHYGWVVEVNPFTGAAKKHVNLGRFAHESSTCVVSKAGNAVVYSADDKNDEHLYKFISNSGTDFDHGMLYVADTTRGLWIAMDFEKSPILQQNFNSQIEVYTYAREAAKLLGATPLDRPEDIEIHPTTGDIFIALTNNTPKGNFHGSILKISEDHQDYNSLSFTSETFVIGGEDLGLSCPDNLAFDKNGNLWVASDISGSKIGKLPYTKFGNNGLFVIPTKGPQAGLALQVASAPVDAEFTGICFSPDYQQLFLSVQHPGENSSDLNHPTSHWPDGGIPKSSVVVIEGPLLNQLNS
jgi:uncharacterized protein